MSETNADSMPTRKEKSLRLSVTLREQFYEFVNNTSVARMNRVLRDLVPAYLKADPREAAQFFKSDDYKELQMLFYLFEIIEEEYTGEE